MSVRWRLTLWFALILALILALSGVLLYILLQRYLIRDIDNNLKVHAAEVHGTLNPNEIPEPVDYDVVHSKLPAINEFASPGIYLQLINHSGETVVKSDNLGELELPVDPSLISQGFSGTTAIKTLNAGSGASVRVMVSPLFLQDEVLLLEVAQSLNYVDDTMLQVRWALVGSSILALALAAVSGGVLVRRALSPVREISRTARSIEAGSDLAQRVGYTGPEDEIGELATTFDHMIEQLDRAFQSQRYFVADASHELRGPLTVIRGNLDLLKRRLDDEARTRSMKTIEQEALRMSRIVDDLLLLAEVESGQPVNKENVSLRQILDEEMARSRNLAGTKKLTIERQEDLTVKGDTLKLKQLFSNLVDNAIKYTPEAGRITLSLFRDGPWAKLQVTDTGIGIDAADLPVIFDRFYRVDKARSRSGGSGGTGLGLAIAKGIADLHGGRITVESSPGHGSTFTVWLKL